MWGGCAGSLLISLASSQFTYAMYLLETFLLTFLFKEVVLGTSHINWQLFLENQLHVP